MNLGTRRVVITGMGVVTPFGSDLQGFWQALLEGRSAVAPIRRFDASGFPCRIAAEVPDFRLSEESELPADWDGLERVGRYAALATSRAMKDSQLPAAELDPRRIGLILASGRGSYEHEEVIGPAALVGAVGGLDQEELARHFRASILPRFTERRTPGSLLSRISTHYRIGGCVSAPMTACATGTQSIGDAARWIRLGRADIVIAGASDCELFPMGLASFCLLKALSTNNDSPARASRPFDRRRDGFVIGEGAAVLVLESLEHARQRKARIYAEVAGFGSASDAFRVTDPHPEARGAVLALRRTLANAGVDAREVGYINAHGTSTPANDRIETLAIKEVFGEAAKQVMISSTKSMIGHLTIAAGAIETVVLAMTLSTGKVHPTINLEEPDPLCDLDYVPNCCRTATLEYALSNSFGFGGQCDCLLLRAWKG